MQNEKDILMLCLEENGIIVDQEGNLPDIESIVFISTVISIEEEFGIEFPDEYLNISYFNNIDDILRVIIQIKDVNLCLENGQIKNQAEINELWKNCTGWIKG